MIKEAQELSSVPNDRELDVLLSSGEQMAMSKLSILLNQLGYDAVSLTGWQAGIYTNTNYQKAKIEEINTARIEEELEKGRIIIIAGFQGIDENYNITTFGRGGSDTTAVAVAAALNAECCYIYSDVDGVYTSDPKKIPEAKKLERVSYEEMLDIASEGAKVLHNRCIEVGQKYSIPIITRSTFNNNPGTVIQDKMEDVRVKSIVKNDDIIYVQVKHEAYSIDLFHQIYETLLKNNIIISHLANNSTYSLNINFTINAADLAKVQKVLKNEFHMLNISYTNISRISIIGYGILNDNTVINDAMEVIKLNKLEVLYMYLKELRITIMFKENIPNSVLEQLHNKLIK